MGDICDTRNKSFPQIEKDTDFMAQSLKDGKSFTHRMFEEYQADMKQKDNYPAKDQPYLTHNALVMEALYCKDKQDVTLLSKVKDFGPGKTVEFNIDFWRADTNEIYEEAKGHPVDASLIAGADKALNHNIPQKDFQLATELFNARARADNSPMEVVIDGNGQLHLQPKTTIVSNKP